MIIWKITRRCYNNPKAQTRKCYLKILKRRKLPIHLRREDKGRHDILAFSETRSALTKGGSVQAGLPVGSRAMVGTGGTEKRPELFPSSKCGNTLPSFCPALTSIIVTVLATRQTYIKAKWQRLIRLQFAWCPAMTATEEGGQS